MLDREERWLLIEDSIESGEAVPVRLAFHLGPAIGANLTAEGADLAWLNDQGPQQARLSLPTSLTWRAWRGSLDPMLGWYAPCFGQRVPATTLVGEGTLSPDEVLRTMLTMARG